jgi:hypothetical protein
MKFESQVETHLIVRFDIIIRIVFIESCSCVSCFDFHQVPSHYFLAKNYCEKFLVKIIEISMQECESVLAVLKSVASMTRASCDPMLSSAAHHAFLFSELEILQ